MSEPMYDFRDGILLEKVVYKDDSCNFGYVLIYIACLLLTWIWGCGWFALFFYSYIFHEKATFITFIVIWGVFAIGVVVIGFLTIQKSKNQKAQKAKIKAERERQLKEIQANKKRRHENRINNINNNLEEINTNIETNQNNNDLIDVNSERKPVIDDNEANARGKPY